MHGNHDTHQPPHHVVAQCCATPSRFPRAASATTASLSTAASPAWSQFFVAHASGCHLFDGKEFLCGQDHSLCENAHQHLGFESYVAVFHGMCLESVLCVDMQCGKTCCFITKFLVESTSHQKGCKIEKVNVSFGSPFLHTTIHRNMTLVHCGSLAPVHSHKPANPSRVSASCSTPLHMLLSGSQVCKHRLASVFPTLDCSGRSDHVVVDWSCWKLH